MATFLSIFLVNEVRREDSNNTKSWAIIGPPAKRHFNFDDSPTCIFGLVSL